MNEITQKQYDELSKEFNFEYDESDGFYLVKPKPPEESPFAAGKKLNIILKPFIVNEPANYSLSLQWNKGRKFYSDSISITINKTSGKMINVSGHDDLGNLIDEMWIPQGGIEEVEVIG